MKGWKFGSYVVKKFTEDFGIEATAVGVCCLAGVILAEV
jgi:hypothetical protein